MNNLSSEDLWQLVSNWILQAEGGYVNDPIDPGGETKYGISRKVYPTVDIKNLTLDKAKEIYRRDYWAACRCDYLPQRVALAVFDGAVNMGAKTSIKILQVCLGVTPDGVIGPVTLSALENQSEHRVLRNILAQRAVNYMKVILNNPTLWKFSLGWMRRMFSLAEVLYLAWPRH